MLKIVSTKGQIAAYTIVVLVAAGGFFRLENTRDSDQENARDARVRIQATLVQTQTELCSSIDADHNRQRAEIVRGTKQLFAIPEFKALIPTDRGQRLAVQSARHRYNAIRKTRPDFCAKYSKNPVPKFPTLDEFANPSRKEAKGVSRKSRAPKVYAYPGQGSAPSGPQRGSGSPPSSGVGVPPASQPVQGAPPASTVPPMDLREPPAAPNPGNPDRVLPDAVCDPLKVHLPPLC